jgi:cation transport ATPase
MNEDKDIPAERPDVTEAETEADRIQQAAEAAASDPAFQQEWIRQSNLIYGGLTAAGLVMVQPFLTESSLDTSALVCVIAFAVSIPLLAALLMLNWQEAYRRRASKSPFVEFAKSIAQGSAFVGITAAFWHMSLVAGIVFLAMGIVALGVHSSGYVRLEYDSKFGSRFHKTPEA